MGVNKYRLVGSVAPGSRIERVDVEPARTEIVDDQPVQVPAKVLVLDEARAADGVELTQQQHSVLSQHVVLELVNESQEGDLPDFVDQPLDPPRVSESTVGFTGTSPDLEGSSKEELLTEVDRVRGLYHGALSEVKGNSSKEEIKGALFEFYNTHEV